MDCNLLCRELLRFIMAMKQECGAAMILIAAGVVLGQAGWAKIFGLPESF